MDNTEKARCVNYYQRQNNQFKQHNFMRNTEKINTCEVLRMFSSPQLI